MRNFLTPVYNEIGHETRPDDDDLTVFLRGVIVNWACKMGVDECKAKTVEDFEKWFMQPGTDSAEESPFAVSLFPYSVEVNPVDSELRPVGYCQAVAEGEERAFDFVLDRMLKENVDSERQTLLGSLTCTKEVWLLSRLLNMTLYAPESGVPLKKLESTIIGVSRNIYGRELATAFVKDNFDKILKM